MIVHKAVELHPPVNSAVLVELSSDGMCNLKIIIVIVPGIKTFMQLIICHAVQEPFPVLNIAAVVPVNHLAHQPEILLLFLCGRPHLFHESKVKAVRAVQPYSVDVKFVNPETYHIQKIIANLLILQVQIHQFKAVSPCLIGKSVIIPRIASKPDSFVPSAVTGSFSLFLNITERKKFSARVIEHSVHYDLYAQFMGMGDKCLEIFIVSQTAINGPVISRIVAVGGRLEQRADINRPKSQIRRVLQPFIQNIKAMCNLFLLISCRCAAKSQRINVIKFCCLVPWCHVVKPPSHIFWCHCLFQE